ncbi:UDP-N-acetyl-D-mannosaminuronic acid dehydrogenase [Haladaptatus litoreus]|uniref:UDP-N-acetyl-D-mannosamine dehydrogenase n=1 Tax=Haladaptatus litoreus TaxID=553468 RepID=A0A1N7DLG8_9EURY|nr:nucleotide sugar dehydrogenase [Haladaptatus litoreus]SIR76608.1 UDP-N-acetyl-D-mannosaminuronic acid dehydrogenase [Haladaptatus litoreus]
MSTLCIHGLGYIGLPTAAMFANYDHDVVGYDTSEEVVTRLSDGEVHFDEPGLRAFVTQAIESEQLTISNEVVEAKYHIICVPTPFDRETKEAGLEYVESAGQAIEPHLRPGDTVILESTVPPGTTADVLRPILEESGLDAGEDFALAHCPETVLPGDIITELKQNARIIGGVNGVSTEAAVRLYESFVEAEIHTTANATTAEFVKLIQNTFRDANIAIANEIAKLAHDYEIDSREAISLANEHPRVNIHHPGPGVGGHCLPVDPWFLGQNSEELDLIKHAREVNDGMSGYIIDILKEELGGLEDTKIAIFGVAYKGNVGDTRESPGLKLARELQAVSPQQEIAMPDGGVEVDTSSSPSITLHDPHVNDQTLQLLSREEAVDGADAIVIATDHDEFEEIDPLFISRFMNNNLVIDSKAILDEDRWNTEGFRVSRI